MPVFEYIARDKGNNTQKGKLEANSMSSLVRQLREKGLFVTSISPASEESSKGNKLSEIKIFKKKVKPKELVLFSRQFATMLNSGMDIIESLGVLEKSDNPTLREVISEIKEDVEEGKYLAKALSEHPKVFNNLYVNMMEAAESSGSYSTVLFNIANELEKAEKIKQQVKSAVMVPLMTFIFAILLSFGLIKFVVPQFMGLYGNLGNLPKPTQILISLSNFVQGTNGLILLLVVILSAIGFKIFVSSDRGRYIWDKIKLKLPLFGPVFKKISIASFSRTLSLLLDSDVNYLKSLEIVSNAAKNKVLAKILKDAKASINRGGALSKPLMESIVFPPMVIQMIRSGEKSGRVPEMLNEISKIYEEEVDRSVENLTELLTPILTVLIGVIVAGLLLGLYMPIFKMGEMIAG